MIRFDTCLESCNPSWTPCALCVRPRFCPSAREPWECGLRSWRWSPRGRSCRWRIPTWTSSSRFRRRDALRPPKLAREAQNDRECQADGKQEKELFQFYQMWKKEPGKKTLRLSKKKPTNKPTKTDKKLFFLKKITKRRWHRAQPYWFRMSYHPTLQRSLVCFF